MFTIWHNILYEYSLHITSRRLHFRKHSLSAAKKDTSCVNMTQQVPKHTIEGSFLQLHLTLFLLHVPSI